mmetsp:Transcript_31743/g.87699  ORF Transcript_31743/g.87699 Transcript_31743/m.87699 type:complete len:247 (+) Transcript_31743:637-1377(+)
MRNHARVHCVGDCLSAKVLRVGDRRRRTADGVSHTPAAARLVRILRSCAAACSRVGAPSPAGSRAGSAAQRGTGRGHRMACRKRYQVLPGAGSADGGSRLEIHAARWATLSRVGSDVGVLLGPRLGGVPHAPKTLCRRRRPVRRVPLSLGVRRGRLGEARGDWLTVQRPGAQRTRWLRGRRFHACVWMPGVQRVGRGLFFRRQPFYCLRRALLRGRPGLRGPGGVRSQRRSALYGRLARGGLREQS